MGSHLNACALTNKLLYREHMNIVFIGHVDAGKSPIGGKIVPDGECLACA